MEARPIYENGDTLAVEEATVRKVAGVWRCEYRKLPRQYRIDWALLRSGKIAAWCECKRRHNQRNKYPSLMLSLSKVAHGLDLERQTGLPFLLVIEWDDCLAYLKAQGIGPLRFGGRSDRGDWQDQEPVVDFPVDEFKRIGR